MKFKPLLDRWKKEAAPVRTAREYAVRLPLEDASRLHALAALFPGRQIEDFITDLLHAALDEVAAAMPYERGPKIIAHDDQGDPVYEDVGLTPRFIELARQFKKSLEAAVDAPRGAAAP
ncbi:MAG: type 1 pili tip component [Pseudomonadota bacterium]|nr:type 1 pili tip component [Pseudomonadota bacterium]